MTIVSLVFVLCAKIIITITSSTTIPIDKIMVVNTGFVKHSDTLDSVQDANYAKEFFCLTFKIFIQTDNLYGILKHP